MIPDQRESGEALENLVNTSTWIHIDHADGKQRVVVSMPDGRIIGEESTFIGHALAAAWSRAKSPEDS